MILEVDKIKNSFEKYNHKHFLSQLYLNKEQMNYFLSKKRHLQKLKG